MFKLALIDNSVDTDIYNPVRHWSPYLPPNFKTFRAIRGQLPDPGQDFTHMILTGSEATIMKREPWVEREIDLVRSAVSRGWRILGSCYGHQLLAIALSGPSAVRRAPEPEGGWIEAEVVEDNVLVGRRGTVETFTLHFDEVINPGEDCSVFLKTETCPVQGFQLTGQPVWGLQIHPEINPREGRRLLENLIALDSPARAFYERSLARTPRDSNLIPTIVKSFLES